MDSLLLLIEPFAAAAYMEALRAAVEASRAKAARGWRRCIDDERACGWRRATCGGLWQAWLRDGCDHRRPANQEAVLRQH